CAGFACAVAAAAGTAGSPLAPPGSGRLPEGCGGPVGTACSRIGGTLSLTVVASTSAMARRRGIATRRTGGGTVPDTRTQRRWRAIGGEGGRGPTVTRCLTTRPRHAGGPPGGRARTRGTSPAGRGDRGRLCRDDHDTSRTCPILSDSGTVITHMTSQCG